MRARGNGGRRGADCAVRKRASAQRLPTERPLPPTLINFRSGPEGARGGWGVERPLAGRAVGGGGAGPP